jgi:uncharacterized membrane protein
MQVFFGILTAILPLVAAIPYIRDILRKKTKPQRASFLIWAILGLIAFFTQLAEGAEWSLLLPAADTLAVVVIFLLAIRYGMGGFNKEDKLALGFAVLGLVLWYLTNEPLVALIITIMIDATATVLTVHKTYKNPHTETFISWFLATMSGFTAIFAVGEMDPTLLAYPIYIFLANGAVAIAIVLGKK